MKAVIMAGGLGERLRPFTKIIPKPLLPVGNRSVLEIQIINMAARGVTEIYLALGYKHEMFDAYLGDGSKWGVNIRYSVEGKPLGTAGPLSLVRDYLDEPFLVVNGDILTDLDYSELRDAHIAGGADVTVVSHVIVLPLQYGVIKHDGGDRIVDITEKPSVSAEINAGIYFMNSDILDLLPRDTPVSMDDFLRRLIAAGYVVGRFLLKNYWLDIGQMSDYAQANEVVTKYRFA